MTSLSLYLTKYLIDLFVPYGSLLETNILSTSMLCILNVFCSCFCKNIFFKSRKFVIFPIILILGKNINNDLDV